MNISSDEKCYKENIMSYKRIGTLLVLAFPLLGCTTVNVALEGEVDPAFSPKTSAVAVVLPDDPTIEERQLLPVLQDQLAKSGYTVTDASLAVWMLGIGTRRDVQFAGYSTSGGVTATKIGDVIVGSDSSQSKAEYKKTVLINLWLFHAAEYREGKRITVWEGSESTDLNTFHAEPALLVAGLIKIVGHNFYNEKQDLTDDLWTIK